MTKDSAEHEGFVTTAVRVPREVLSLLRQAALVRAERDGGRVSVSGALSDFLLQRRSELVEGPGR